MSINENKKVIKDEKIVKPENIAIIKEENDSPDYPLCEKCNSKMMEEEGKLYCPNCDGEIDYFGDKDDENN